MRKAAETWHARASIQEVMLVTAVVNGKNVPEGYEIVLKTTGPKTAEVTVASDWPSWLESLLRLLLDFDAIDARHPLDRDEREHNLALSIGPNPVEDPVERPAFATRLFENIEVSQ